MSSRTLKVTHERKFFVQSYENILIYQKKSVILHEFCDLNSFFWVRKGINELKIT